MKPKSFDDLYQEAEAHDDYWVAGLVQEFTEEIVHLMDSGSITRSELARRLETSPAYVTKILLGNANFTLATMVRLTRALGAELSVKVRPAKGSCRSAQAGRVIAKRAASARHSSRPATPVPVAADSTR